VNNYPKHKHPHSIIHKEPNGERIVVCDECYCVFTEDEIMNDAEKKEWGHLCKKNKYRHTRCESHCETYEPCPPKPDQNKGEGGE